MCRDGIRKVKTQLELNLPRDANNKDFHRYDRQKRKVKERGLPLTSKTGKLITND